MSDVEFNDREGTPESVPTKEPDATLRLTDDGIEMPEFLKGYVGKFTMRTASITGEFETTESGLPTDEFYDSVLASYPGNGEYHGDLREGLMAVSVPDQPEVVYEVVDERSNGDGGETQ